MSILTYIFYPNPGNADYSSPKALTMLIVCVLFILASVALRMWRKRMTDAKMRQLSRSWTSAVLWFGLVGLVLVVARVEQIQYVAMRLWWIVWLLALAAYAFLQFRLFKSRYYTVLPTAVIADPRNKYLPTKKKR